MLLAQFHVKTDNFDSLQVIIIYTKCGVRAYANRMGVRAVRVRW